MNAYNLLKLHPLIILLISVLYSINSKIKQLIFAVYFPDIHNYGGHSVCVLNIAFGIFKSLVIRLKKRNSSFFVETIVYLSHVSACVAKIRVVVFLKNSPVLIINVI